MKIDTWQLHLGNCKKLIKDLEDNSIDSIVTDPPYELGFMGKKWDNSGIAYDVELWTECLRVLKPGGHLLAFSGSRTYHRMAVAIEDSGFDIRDQIMWIYGSGFPKSHNIGKAVDKMQRDAKEWNGWGTALKPAHEPICVARKPLIGTVAENVLKYGTGGINIDGCRVFTDESWQRIKGSKEGLDGNFLKGKKKIPQFSNTNGRWPANFIHDGSDEVVELFPESTTWAAKKPKYYDTESIFGVGGVNFAPASTGSAARFFYCAKASKKDRDEGCEVFQKKARQTMSNGIGGQPNQDLANNHNHHPTVKPTDLMRYLCRLVTPPNGIILDPFTGSGSTGKAAILEGFRFLGFDMQSEYIDIASARIKHAEKIKDNKLFD